MIWETLLRTIQFMSTSWCLHGSRVLISCPHEYWAFGCNFEMGMRTNCKLTKIFVGWNNMKVSAFSPRDFPVVYDPVPCL